MVFSIIDLQLLGALPLDPTMALPLDPRPQSPGFVPLRNKFLATPLCVAAAGKQSGLYIVMQCCFDVRVTVRLVLGCAGVRRG